MSVSHLEAVVEVAEVLEPAQPGRRVLCVCKARIKTPIAVLCTYVMFERTQVQEEAPEERVGQNHLLEYRFIRELCNVLTVISVTDGSES